MKKTLLPVLLSFSTMFLLTGCNTDNIMNQLQAYMPEVKAGETISADSTWINSDVAGAVDETVSISEKDDFHTAVNRDWLIQTKLDTDDSMANMDSFSTTEDVLNEQISQLLVPAETLDLDETLMDASTYQHVEGLVTSLASLIDDWEARDARGTEPVQKYIKRIEQIQSLDDLTDYLKNKDQMNLSMAYPVDFSTATPTDRRDAYTVALGPTHSFSLSDQDSYISLPNHALEQRSINYESASYILSPMGYSDDDIRKMLRQCYDLEWHLAQNMCSVYEMTDESYATSYVTTCDLERLQQLQGNYPLTEILAAYGLDGSDSYMLYEEDYLKTISKLYSEKRLEQWKAYYIIQTIQAALPFMDHTCYEYYSSYDENALKLDDQLSLNFLSTYLSDAMDQVYVARYCTSQEKQDLEHLIQETLSYYRTMLAGEDWMSDATKEKAIEKLDHIYVRVLYPDVFTDYSSLNYSSEGTLTDAINAITQFKYARMKADVNAEIDKNRWFASTRDVNAYYMPSDNSINILAGLLADGFFHDPDAPYEQNLGRLGLVIGHEITHAFDTSGYLYDKDGLQQRWWTPEDEEAFQLRANKLIRFYNGISLFGSNYNGNTVQTEAIADMGGLKCMLAIAKEDPDFDYALFFRSYAACWKAKRTELAETTYMTDSHPLGFLRTNVTIQQFDEFYKTFDIKEGDGMYLAPEKRILVW